MNNLIARAFFINALIMAASSLPVKAQLSFPNQCPPPVMGWSSWNTYAVNISDKLIESQADALVNSGLKDVGYSYINIDDGFFGGRDRAGNLIPNKEKFPEGMRIVSDYIHSLGLKAGIYSEAGSNTCGSIWNADSLGIGSGLLGHEQQDIDLFLKEWNYDFIKIDYCGGKALGLDEEERYGAIAKAIRNTGRNDVSVNICRWAFPGTWAKEYARSWRISPDINASWNSVKNIILKNLYLSAYAGEGHYNDMDMLEIGRGLSRSEEEVHFGIWCIMSSPLLIGCDLTTIPGESLELLKNKELIALNQDALGLQAYVVQHENDGYALAKDIISKRGGTRAVALYNPSDTAIHFDVPLESLEFAGKVKVRDLVIGKDLGAAKGSIKAVVGPHSVKILTVKGKKRTEPTVYEAEWAYLPCFDDLMKRTDPIIPTYSENASGKMMVSNIGGREGNEIQWNDVYSEKGGECIMTVYYACENARTLEVSVNGAIQVLDNLSSGVSGRLASAAFPIHLKKGANEIRMFNPYGQAPDIDRFVLERTSRPNLQHQKNKRDAEQN